MGLSHSYATKQRPTSHFIYEKKLNYKRHDQLFKQLIKPLFEQFLKAFYPHIHEQIDFKTITFLSEELYTATYKGDKRILDLAVQVQLKTTHQPLIIHIEPQSYVQTDFNNRMFKYYSLLYNELEKPILPIAIFSYDEPWEENEFISHVVDVEVLHFNYLTLHLKKLNWRHFSNKKNPVSAALLSKMNYEDDERVAVKLAFLKILASLKLTEELNHLVVGFFESYLQLSKKEEEALMKEASKLDKAEEILKLPISYEERGKEIGKEIGEEIGKEIGERLGREEERREIALNMLRECVEVESVMKFTKLSREEVERLAKEV